MTSNSTPEDLSSWIPAGTRGGDRYRIGLAHGRWQGYSGGSYPVNFIAANRAEAAGLDYLALGDFHSYTLADHPAASARCYYAGTSECTACDEPRAGFALLVQVDKPGGVPRVSPQRMGKMPHGRNRRSYRPTVAMVRSSSRSIESKIPATCC